MERKPRQLPGHNEGPNPMKEGGKEDGSDIASVQFKEVYELQHSSKFIYYSALLGKF